MRSATDAYIFAVCMGTHIIRCIRAKKIRLGDCRLVDSHWRKIVEETRFVIYNLEFVDWDIPKKWVVMYTYAPKYCEKRKKFLSQKGVLLGLLWEDDYIGETVHEEELRIKADELRGNIKDSNIDCVGGLRIEYMAIKNTRITADNIYIWETNMWDTNIKANTITLVGCDPNSCTIEADVINMTAGWKNMKSVIKCNKIHLDFMRGFAGVLEAKKVFIKYAVSMERITGKCEVLYITERANICGPLADSARIIRVLADTKYTVDEKNADKIVVV
jgi:hypothetical protein